MRHPRRFARSSVVALAVAAALAVALALQSAPALAGSITAELGRTEFAIDDSVPLVISITGSAQQNLNIPDVPGLVFEQHGISESTVITNGQMVSETSVNFEIRAQKTGEFTIPSIRLKIDDKEEATVPLHVRVVAAGSSSGGNNAQNGGGGQPQQQQQGGSAPKGKDTGGVALERTCDKTDPYVGEQMICTVRIYHRGNLAGGQRLAANAADFRRFAVEGEKRYQKVVDQHRVNVIELTEIIVPLRAGDLTMPTWGLEARVLVPSRRGGRPIDRFIDQFGGGMFNFDMGFNEEKNVTIETAPQTIHVKAPPTEGRPPNYQGLVGDLQLAANVSPASVKTGETTTLTIELQGSGLVDDMREPPLPTALKDMKSYPDKPDYKESITADAGVSGKKTFRWALVPKVEGTLDLGAIEIPAFNPKLGRYVVLRAELGKLIVSPGEKEAPTTVVAATPPDQKRDVSQLREDLLAPHELAQLASHQELTTAEATGLGGAAAAPYALALLALSRGRLTRRRAPKRPTPLAAFDALAATAATHASAGRSREAVAALGEALHAFARSATGRWEYAFTTREAVAELTRRGAPPDRLTPLAEELERATFSATTVGPADLQRLTSSLRDLLAPLEAAK